MEYLVGLLLALEVGVGTNAFGFDKDRSFYSTVLMVVASCYLLFAAMAGARAALAAELVAFAAFLILAVLGARRWPVLVAIGLLAHGVFDLLHGHLVANPGVPSWWPGFCLAYDVAAGAYLMLLIARRRGFAATNAAIPSFTIRAARRPSPAFRS